jgi:hypothetical protein
MSGSPEWNDVRSANYTKPNNNMKHTFNSKLTFSAEPYKQKIRFVVAAEKKEWVCRIETFKAMEQFLASPDVRIFKGRLQLLKNQRSIHVEVNKSRVGTIPVSQMKQILDACR